MGFSGWVEHGEPQPVNSFRNVSGLVRFVVHSWARLGEYRKVG